MKWCSQEKTSRIHTLQW